MTSRPQLLFVSPRFLFPVDSGGKIRTTQILRGLKGGRFRIKLLSPGSAELARLHQTDLESICDDFQYWQSPPQNSYRKLLKVTFLLGSLPVPIRADVSARARRLVSESLAESPAVVVFDFLHGAVLAPRRLGTPSVLFTHNVEAEIFQRHRDAASNPLMKAMWSNQSRKMFDFEHRSLSRFDVVVAVSDRDAAKFMRDYAYQNAIVIPTGVDTDYFRHLGFAHSASMVFCGSMDWLANQDAIRYFMDEIWPLIIRDIPDAQMKVIGRAAPEALVRDAQRRGLRWQFTGFVDDVREHVTGSSVSVIPLRIGGGTRLKVYESMAMGPAVVSTSIGVEGLPVIDGVHCSIADDARTFAAAVVAILRDHSLQQRLSSAARAFVEESCGYRLASRVFEAACEQATRKVAG